MERISVAILGSGRIVQLLSQRISSRHDLHLIGVAAIDQEPSADARCVIHLPSSEDMGSGNINPRICSLLRAGFNVVSTVPPEALDKAAILAAAREGGSTFHGSGGFQTRLTTRFNRAFASITRNLSKVELVEELDIGDETAYPWPSPVETGLDDTDPQLLASRAGLVRAFYEAGLHALADAAFADTQAEQPITEEVYRRQPDHGPARTGKTRPDDQLRVMRALGSSVTYDSEWTRNSASDTPLRYRLTTTSSDAIGHVTITFQQGGDIHPADHLTCSGLLDALRPVVASAPGILHHDLDIYHVKADDRL